MKDYKKLKVIFLIGDFRSRLNSVTKILSKPLVTIGNEPMIIHITKIFFRQGVANFYFATAYKK